MSQTFVLSSTHNTATAKRTALRCDHSALSLGATTVEIKDQPVVRAPEFVRTGGVGVQGGEVPRSASRVQDRQPRLSLLG